MRLDLYQAESERIANEQSGVLHALQVLIENAIGKSKHLLKSAGEPVPVSANDTFASLEQHGDINPQEPRQWNSAIGLRNRIVHDYMNIDFQLVYELITNDRLQFIAVFLHKPILAMPN